MSRVGRFQLSPIALLLGAAALFLAGGTNIVVGKPELSLASVEVAGPAAFAPQVSPYNVKEESAPELAAYMGDLQRMVHKLNLSLMAENPELSAFYLHEVEEVLEQAIEIFPHHDGFPVGEMLGKHALASLGPLEDALASEDWNRTSRGFLTLIESCNSCHWATSHGFIVITPASVNPFNQDFER